MSLALLSSFIGIMPVLATQGEGHTVSQNPKAPLTGEQLNALPPEVQANVQRMMNAAPYSTRPKADGTESTVYHTPSYKHEKAQEFAKRQGNQNAAAPGTPLAEEVLKGEDLKKLTARLEGQGNKVTVDSLDAFKKAAYEYKDVKKPFTCAFTDAADFITRYDVYQPFLTNCNIIHLHFQKSHLTGTQLKETLNTFSNKFVQNKPKKWKDYSQIVLFMDRAFIVELDDDRQMQMEVTATLARFTNLIVAGHSPEGAQVCKAFKIEEKNCPIWGFFMP